VFALVVCAKGVTTKREPRGPGAAGSGDHHRWGPEMGRPTNQRNRFSPVAGQLPNEADGHTKSRFAMTGRR